MLYCIKNHYKKTKNLIRMNFNFKLLSKGINNEL